MASPRSIEVKVGLLILIAVGILSAFIIVMGGVSFQRTFRMYAEFDNPGGVQTGAPVKIAGMVVGRIKEIEFRGSVKSEPGKPRPSLVRLVLAIESRYQNSIHDDSIFYVTTQGLLGEAYLAIDPGSADHPVLQEGAVARGIDPPRLDLVLAEGFDLVHTAAQALRDNRDAIPEIIMGMKRTLKGTGDFFENNKDKIDRIASNLDQLSGEANELIKAAHSRYVDNPQIDRIINNIDHTTTALSRDSEPLFRDARQTLANVNRLSATVGAPEEQARIKQAISDVADIANHAKQAVNDTQTIVAHIKKGEGSIGALVMDEQLYDDLQEMVRDLKHNPWKFFWRE